MTLLYKSNEREILLDIGIQTDVWLLLVVTIVHYNVPLTTHVQCYQAVGNKDV